MSTWNIIQRSVMLRANQLQANSAADLATAYANPVVGQTEMADRAVEFPFDAINDAILDACDRLIGVISMDPSSPYRNFFAGVTGNLASGLTVPLVSTLSKPRVGVVGEVRETTSGKMMVLRPYQDVIGVLNMQLKMVPLWYYTDNVRIWHTKVTVIADIVVWDKAEQLTLMNSDPRGECPFPQDLHEAIICGALGYIFRGDFNNEQIAVQRKYFEEKLSSLSSQSSS